jgi:LacI family transcriptional regulator
VKPSNAHNPASQLDARGLRFTQADVARRAGVSQATVSMILNERADGRVSDETRARVLEVIRESGYVANSAARSMAGGRTGILGVYTFEPVFPMDSRDFYFPFLLGVERTAEALGYDLLLFSSTGGRRLLYGDRGTRLLLADGALMIGQRPNVSEIERLRDDGYPFVYIGKVEVSGAPISYVACDYTTATRSLTEDLVALGHRRIAYVRRGDEVSQSSRDRERGFHEGAVAAGLAAPDTPTWNVQDVNAAAQLVDGIRTTGTTALLFEQPTHADAFAAAAASRGLSIPDDMSVVVLNIHSPDSQWTGFRVPRERMGEIATERLVKLTADRGLEASQELVECTFVTGRSTAPAAASRSAHR